ncbi:hypothetical protein QTP70_028125 [Hemibagrus guttatus]|uniref:Uncharacterized protein n=1 Tax=Hemibagrus guttatus TaxID=175788 RepID=A0AAE0UNT6_9TELE|nr:hypothetical protein QTP70_028125 [Hemibagrus guttatus]
MWNKWVTDLTRDVPSERPLDFWGDVVKILSEGNNRAFVYQQISDKHYKNIDTLGDYSHYLPSHDLKVEKNDTPELSDDENIRLGDLIRNIINESEEKFKTICMSIEKLGYKDSYIQLITDHMKERVRNHNKADQIQVTKKLALHLCLLVCDLMSERIMEHHKRFRDSNDPRVYLSKQKPQYYRVFKCYCRGATAAHVFGELICNNLKESILQSVYNQTAVDLAAQIRSDMEEFNRNKTKLEKHILKHLAEKENFPEYMEYVHYPQKYFKSFISKQVHKYITENHTKVLQLFKINLNNMEQIVVKALNTATDEVKKSQGKGDNWMIIMSHSLQDEILIKEISFTDHKEVKDFDFLQQVVSAALAEMMSKLNKSFDIVEEININKFTKKPDEILIEHLCGCCWAQCPFCKAICTNTVNGHSGDHRVPFHRVMGVELRRSSLVKMEAPWRSSKVDDFKDASRRIITDTSRWIITDTSRRIITYTSRRIITYTTRRIITDMSWRIITDTSRRIITDTSRIIITYTSRRIITYTSRRIITYTSRRIITDTSRRIITDISRRIITDISRRIITYTSRRIITYTSRRIITDISRRIITCTSRRIITDTSRRIITDTSRRIITDISRRIITDISRRIITYTSRRIITYTSRRIITDISRRIITCTSRRIITDTSRRIITDTSRRIITYTSRRIITYTSSRIITDISRRIITYTSRRIITYTSRRIITYTSRRIITDTSRRIITDTSRRIITDISRRIITYTSRRIITYTSRRIITYTIRRIITDISKRIITYTSRRIITYTSRRIITDISRRIITYTSRRIITDTNRGTITYTSRRIITDTSRRIITYTSRRIITDIRRRIITYTSRRITTDKQEDHHLHQQEDDHRHEQEDHHRHKQEDHHLHEQEDHHRPEQDLSDMADV